MGRCKIPARCAVPILKKIFDTADERNVPLAFLCDKADVYPAQMSEWRAGRHTPSIFVIMSLAAALGMELTLNGATA